MTRSGDPAPCCRGLLPDDVDHSFHAEPGVVAAVLGFHEARQHVPAAVVADDELLVGTVRYRPGEGAEPGGQVLRPALLAFAQEPGDLACIVVAAGGEEDGHVHQEPVIGEADQVAAVQDRKSTRLNSSHRTISYAVF